MNLSEALLREIHTAATGDFVKWAQERGEQWIDETGRLLEEFEKLKNMSVCPNCGGRVNIKTNEGHKYKECDHVWGRRGWRQLGAYDG